MVQPHEQRVLDEKHALDLKLEALTRFLDGDTFPKLPLVEARRLIRQRAYMGMYSAVLNERIEAFGFVAVEAG